MITLFDRSPGQLPGNRHVLFVLHKNPEKQKNVLRFSTTQLRIGITADPHKTQITG
jgi:hypothetical protein